jgi:hypothetical protein
MFHGFLLVIELSYAYETIHKYGYSLKGHKNRRKASKRRLVEILVKVGIA